MVCKCLLPFHRLPFHFADCSLCCAEAFYLIQSCLFVFAFVACAFGVLSKNLLPRPTSRNFSPVFSSKRFIVAGLTFKSFIWVHFCEWGKMGSSFIFMCVDFRFHSTICWRDYLFPIECSWLLCQILVDALVYFWALSSVPFVNRLTLCQKTYCFDY